MLIAPLVLSALLSAAPAGAAQPAASAPQPQAEVWKDPANAALVYYKQWIGNTAENDTKVTNAVGSDKPIPEDVVALLHGAQDMMQAYIRAGKMTECDFGVEWTQGFGALLPHLAKARTAARWLALDAKRLSTEGKGDEAAERVAAMYNLATHVAGDRILISSLVSIAISSLADRTAGEVLDAGRPTVQMRDTLLTAARRLKERDFGMMSAIRGERAIAMQMLAKYDGPDAGLQFLREYGTMVFSGNPKDAEKDNARRLEIAKMDAAAIRAELGKLQEYYDAVLAAWNKPDAGDQIKALEDRIAAGEFGQFVGVVGPAFSKARLSHAKGVAGLDALIARLSQL